MARRAADDRPAGTAGSAGSASRANGSTHAGTNGEVPTPREPPATNGNRRSPAGRERTDRLPSSGGGTPAEAGNLGERVSARDQGYKRNAELAQRSAASRVAAANARDAVAHARDLAANARDRAADQRDRELGPRREATPSDDRATTGAEILLRAARYRSDAAADRAAAAQIRANSAAERQQAAHDREQAARDRRQAAMDRDALLLQLRSARTAGFNGSAASSSGLEDRLVDLDRALDRARRMTGPLIVAHVGVITGAAGGAADADEDLGRVVRVIRRHLRRSDLIVRLDSDELVCVMFGVTAESASERFVTVRDDLQAQTDPCGISVGFAAGTPADSLDNLISGANTVC